MCKQVCLINSEDQNNKEKVNINIAATTGIVANGISFSQFEELCSAMNIPVFSSKYYSKLEEEVFEKWNKTASASMEAAAQMEKEIAIAEGRIKNGYPVIDVCVDGSWCARSYGTNYKASSGTAAIIGRRTRQVLYIGIKNKYCLVCARAEHKNMSPKQHKCFKNYEGSSSSMETEIIVEGFKSSITMHGVIYERMIGDLSAIIECAKNTIALKIKNDNEELKNIQNSTLIFRINAIVSNVAAKSRSLIEDVDTNTVECFNSVIAKFIGGKRINFSFKGGYQERCSADVLSFNCQSGLSAVQKAF